ncbi:MAG TPA: threonine/serine dehydratase [Acidimicrobiia bacterium]
MIEPITLAEVEAALGRITGFAFQTPVLRSDLLDGRTGAAVLSKAESSQRAGAFKFRGAYNRLSLIPAVDRPRGVVAVSSGNHGAAVSCAAEILGIPATIFIPEDAPEVKKNLMLGFGASIQTVDRNDPDRDRPARELADSTGATFVHPFEDRDVMIGQGTTALEFHRQVGDLDVLMVPMSGGGLMAGCASAFSALSPGCVFIGVEPDNADDTRRSFAAGNVVSIESVETIADGLAVLSPGENTFAINKTLVSEILTVSESSLVSAMGFALTELGEVVEPSGAAALAALLESDNRWDGSRVGVVLSGGNVDRAHFPEVFVGVGSQQGDRSTPS